MISSGALPNVTFSRPAIPGPDRVESASVASLIRAAAGITASAEAKNTSTGGPPSSFRRSAAGANTLRYMTGRRPVSLKRCLRPL